MNNSVFINEPKRWFKDGDYDMQATWIHVFRGDGIQVH
jgi:hypothetical protein